MSGTKIGIVTVTYNSGKVIEDFMSSLLVQTHENFIAYIIDNASVDDTLSKVSRHNDSRIVVIANPDNRGIASGNNQGIKQAILIGCDQILLINNDTVFEPQLIEKLIKSLVENQCDLVVPKIYYYDRPDLIWCAGGYFNPRRAYGGYHWGIDEVDHGQWDTPQRIDYSPTCCMLIKRQVFDTAGYMDEKYFVYYDDTDFCFRVMQAGLKMFYIPNARLEHKVSSLTGSESTFTLRYMARNRAYFIKKNLKFTQQLMALAYYQGWALFRLLRRQDTPKIYWLRQKYLYEGYSL